MRTVLRALLISLVLLPGIARADERPVNAFDKVAYGYLKDVILKSAEKMPEENYAFKPTEAIRSFGQVLGHVADSNYYFCSKALGETNPLPKIEETKKTKAELVGALKEAFAYCDKAHASITTASTTEMVKFQGMDLSKKDVLTVNNMHTVEHYGNLITYLRLKDIVPPSTEMQQQKKK